MWTDDPVSDAARYYSELEDEKAKLPICSECGEHIQDDMCYEFDGDLICEDCMHDNHRVWTENFIEDDFIE